MKIKGLGWFVNEAEVTDCGTFQQKETNETVAWAKMSYFGGMVSLKITPEDLRKVIPFKGKMVSMLGRQTYEVKKGTGIEKSTFYVDKIDEFKAGSASGIKGLEWFVNEAEVTDCGTFQQKDSNETVAWAKMAYFGGMVSLKITPEDLRKVAPFKGKMVSMSGRQTHEVKKGTGIEKSTFYVDDLKEFKA